MKTDKASGQKGNCLRPSTLFLRVLLGAAALGFIATATFWSARATDRHLREDLLHHSRIAALSIDPQQLSQLSGTAADLGSPEYQQIKKCLALIRAAHPNSRFIYLMGRHTDGSIFFFADSEPNDSEDCSPPGQIFSEASDNLHLLFNTRKELVEGPVRDRWGTWISARVCLPGPQAAIGPVILGMDVDVGHWRQNILAVAALPAGLSIIVGLLGLLALWLLKSRREIKKQGTQQAGLLKEMITSFSMFDAVLDPQGNFITHRFVLINDSFEKSTGVRRQDVIGKTIQEVWPDTDPAWFEICKEVSMEGTPKDFEMFHAQTGRFIHCSIYRPDAGSPRICVFSEDITERHNSQTALEEKEQFLQLLLNTIPIPVFYKDQDGRYLGFNKTCEELLGTRSEALLGKNVFDIHPKELAEIYHAKDAELLEKGGVQIFDSQVKNADGNIRDVTFHKACLTTPDGTVRGLIGTLLDITERKQTEAKTRKLLEESRQAREALLSILEDQQKAEADARRLATAIEQADETIVITDAKGLIEYVNPAFETVTGYTREEALGQNPRILQSGQHDAAFYHTLWETLVIGKTWRGRLINKRKNGETYTEEAVISPVLDKARHITHFVAVKRDITEHMRLSEQVQQSQKMDSIGRLAGGVAHDFNNMLTVILGHAQMALDQAEMAAPLRIRLEEIRKAAERSADLTQQLLAFARKQAIAPRMLNLNETVKGTLKMLQRLIGEDIQLDWNPQDPPGTVEMDPSQIDQILANLCINARDAITGGGTVTIDTRAATIDEAYCADHPTALSGEFVCLSVRDTGCGMDPTTLAQVFEPFFTTKALGQGTGLGLSTVYGIIQQNNGFLEVESTPGEGSAFHIYLPRHNAEATAPAVEPPPPHGSETILIAEDEPAILATTAQMLESVGYTVRTALTPDEALRIVRETPGDIHLLLTDVVMPGMNGWQLSQAILEQEPRIQTLFMSGYTADVIARNGMLEEGVEFIQKPFSKNILARKVRAVLDAQKE